MKNLILLIFLLCTCWVKASTQNVFRLLDTSSGLPDNEVKAQVWLPDERLCVRTSSSLSLFDGCVFRSFPPLVNNMYSIDYVASLPTIYVDAEQRVWCKETGQMFIFDLKTESYVRNVKRLLASMGVKERICNFFIDSSRDYWLVTVSGKLLFCKSQPHSKAIEVQTRVRGLRDVASWNSTHWFVYDDGQVVCWDYAMMKVIRRDSVWKGKMLSRDFVQFSQNTNQLWVMWNHGAASWQSMVKKWQCRYMNEKDVLVTICATSPNVCYIGLRRNGLLTIEADGHMQILPEFKVMNGEIVRDGIQTITYRKNNLMLGMANRGIFLYNPNLQCFPYVALQECGLPNCEYYLSDGKGGEPLLLSSFGVYKIENPKMRAFSLPFSGSDFIRGMVDSQGRFWVGTFKQGFLMWDGKKTYRFMQGTVVGKDINYNIVRGFVEDTHHHIWVSYHGGIGMLNQKFRIVPLRGKGLERYKVINEFHIDREERIWAATSQGLFCFSQKQHKIYFPKNLVNDAEARNLLSGPCKTLLVDTHGWVWVGTLNGVLVLRPYDKYVRHFSKRDGMPNEMVSGMIEDLLGNVWVATANGLCRFSHQKNGKIQMMVFDDQNKLNDSKFGWMSVAHMSREKILFGNQGGFYVVDPTKVQDLSYSGHPIFTSLFVNGQEILPGKEWNGRVVLEKALSIAQKVVLRYDENFITVSFSGLNFDMPRHTCYKYRLRGVNANWVEDSPQDGVGKASYTNLSPGKYELEVYSAGYDKKWCKDPIKLLVIVEPPFWATFWAKLFCLLFLSVIVAYVIRRKMKLEHFRMEMEKNKELEDLKYHFFTNVTHEFRTLLSLIITPIGSILKQTVEPEVREQLKDVNKNAGDLLQLVNQLLDFRKMEMQGEHLCLKSGILGEFVKYIVMKFEPLAEQKHINLKIDDQTNGLFMSFDRDKVGKILNNLLSNAFKYTYSGGEVQVKLSLCDIDNRRFVRIMVVDTGCGISQEDQAHVFERFYRSSHQKTTNVGSGIGLNMVAEYVKMHQGKVSLESKEGKGCRFVVEIPADLKKDFCEERSAMIEAQVDSRLGADKCILLVEDNTNFRNYLGKELKSIYHKVVLAEDGKQGIIYAKQYLPDIIVTDVMMPRMDGIEMCQCVKKNLQTSHIPIILLTAWSTDEGRTEGYRVGADAYISKPFDLDVLLSRIDNLLEKQEKRIQNFAHSPSLDVKNIVGSAPDEKFLSEVISLIEKNIMNSEYTIDSLASDVAMSRMSVYRKMKALTGQTPSDFIRMVRLKAAAALLKAGQRTVTEVCYLTGFATPQNFSKHFKDMFGVVPSQYKD